MFDYNLLKSGDFVVGHTGSGCYSVCMVIDLHQRLNYIGWNIEKDSSTYTPVNDTSGEVLYVIRPKNNRGVSILFEMISKYFSRLTHSLTQIDSLKGFEDLDIIYNSKEKVREMTLSQIEAELGYPVKVIKE